MQPHISVFIWFLCASFCYKQEKGRNSTEKKIRKLWEKKINFLLDDNLRKLCSVRRDIFLLNIDMFGVSKVKCNKRRSTKLLIPLFRDVTFSKECQGNWTSWHAQICGGEGLFLNFTWVLEMEIFSLAQTKYHLKQSLEYFKFIQIYAQIKGICNLQSNVFGKSRKIDNWKV